MGYVQIIVRLDGFKSFLRCLGTSQRKVFHAILGLFSQGSVEKGNNFCCDVRYAFATLF